MAFRSKEGRIGAILLLAFVIIIVAGPALAPYNPTEIGATAPLAGPSWSHPLGGDNLGRDVVSRVLWGGRSVVTVPLLGTTLAMLVGGSVGMFSAYSKGLADALAARTIDILLSLPPILIVLVVVTTFGAGPLILTASVAVVFGTRVARVLRGATQNLLAEDYILAAQARGERAATIVYRELLPNILPTVLVEYALRLAYAIIFVATFNFLGLGLQPPSPNWAVMLAESRPTLVLAPLATLAPALMIGFLAVSIGLLADAATQQFGLDDSRGEFLR
jgi:peptide/nickel transport system permease protein